MTTEEIARQSLVASRWLFPIGGQGMKSLKKNLMTTREHLLLCAAVFVILLSHLLGGILLWKIIGYSFMLLSSS